MHIRIPYITTTIEDDIIMTLYLAPLWWALGFNIFIYQMVALWLLVKATTISIVQHKYLMVPKVAIFLIMLVIVYGLSLLINYPHNELMRTLASFYNLSFWIMGLALIIVVYNFLNVESIRTLSKALRFTVIVCAILSVISIFFWFLGYKNIAYPTLLLKLVPSITDMPLLEQSATMLFLRTDWFAFMLLPRVTVMAPYAMATAFFLVMSIPLAYTFYMGYGPTKRIERGVFILLVTATLMLTITRSDIIAMIIVSLMVYILMRKHHLGFIIIIIPMLFLTFFVFFEIFDFLLKLRGTGSQMRFASYKEALDMFFKGNLLIGVGVKPREEWLKIPIGSHSTYLSLLLKTGFLGLFAFVAFQLHIFRTWFGLRRHNMEHKMKAIFISIGISLISASLIMFTQDLDAPQLVSFVYFLLVGVLTVVSREVLYRRECKRG